MTPQEIFEKFKDIKYGYFDKDGKQFNHISDGFLKKFRLQSVEHIEQTMIAVCWETVEVFRYYLEKYGYKCTTYCFVIPKDKFYNHCLIVYEDNNKFYWMEQSLSKLNGIREYNSLKDLFFDLLDNFNIVVGDKPFDYKDIKIYEYSQPRVNMSCLQFFYHCISSKNITKEYMDPYIKNIALK